MPRVLAASAADRLGPSGRAAWLAVAFFFFVLVLPNRLPASSLDMALVPVELPFLMLFLALAAWNRGFAVAAGIGAVVLMAVTLLLKLADMTLYASLSRPFNIAYDLPLLHAVWMLLSGSSGPLRAVFYIGLGLTAIAVVLLLLAIAARTLLALAFARPGRCALMTGIVAAGIGIASIAGLPTVAASDLLANHFAAARSAFQDIAALRQEAAIDPALERAEPAPLSALSGIDVQIVFVESYGRSTLDNPLYAPTTRSALADIGRALDAAGYAARSAWLTSPTVGGQSWLAHATLLSGLWIDSQGRYDALLRSPRKSINRIASDAGWRSVAVMPAIVLPWPEAEWFGYDDVLAARDLGYRGKPFNWVTMPDQYTLFAFERRALAAGRDEPVFAEIALISSHAPWTPIPTLVPWEAVGDGAVFDDQASGGPSPEELWSDRDRVRDHFRQSIDYALKTIGSFAARHPARRSLFIVLGDHQPASFVSGSVEDRDVPIHVFGDPLVMERLDAWKWTEGLIPTGQSPVWRMDSFRERFLDLFSAVPEPIPPSSVDPA